jgi:hypothetical protein
MSFGEMLPVAQPASSQELLLATLALVELTTNSFQAAHLDALRRGQRVSDEALGAMGACVLEVNSSLEQLGGIQHWYSVRNGHYPARYIHWQGPDRDMPISRLAMPELDYARHRWMVKDPTGVNRVTVDTLSLVYQIRRSVLGDVP